MNEDLAHDLCHDGRYLLGADVGEVWERLSDLDRYPQWWGWLRDFRVEGPGMATGGVLRGAVSPPLPYRFSVAVHLDEVQPRERVVAHLTGDIVGPAEVRLAQHPDGCEATVHWSVRLREPTLRLAAAIAPSAVERGHDRVVRATVDSFQRVLDAPVTPIGGPEPVG